MKHKRTLVTCALPYANGPVHIGHLAGAYIPGDIYVRYLRLREEDTLFICGSDEHGVPITIKAREKGVSPQDIVDEYHKIMKDGGSISTFTRAHLPKCIPRMPRSSSANSMTATVSSLRSPSSFTTRRSVCSSLTG